MKNKNIITIKEEMFFPIQIIIPCYLFLFLSMGEIVISIQGQEVPIISSILFFVFGFVCFTNTGTQINPQEKTYRRYMLLFFMFRTGKWRSMLKYPYITIIPSTNKKVVAAATVNILTADFKEYEITLLDNTHLKQIIVKTVAKLEDAKKDLDYFAKVLDVEITRYAPKGGIYIKH